MENFNLYAKYYDLFYHEKDYSREVNYIERLVRQYQPDASHLLDLGCGTGRHVFEFARRGYTVTGIDHSEQMINRANKELEQQSSGIRKMAKFIMGDGRKVRLDNMYDVITALFHVMSYQLENDDVLDILTTAREHLLPGGVFIFDFWHGPGVLTHRPEVRMKNIILDHTEAIRIARPEFDVSKNSVRVNYHIIIKDSETHYVEEIKEEHRMRYFFQPELFHFSSQAGLEQRACYEWLSERAPSLNTWNAVCILQKDSRR
jgi:SAM-dependent methyltransferase